MQNQNILKLRYLYFLAFLIIFSSCSKQKHNIVFILVDDLGWNDLGYSGSTFYETPHIDALSDQSFVFTNAYASASICSPSRAAIMTGKHPVQLNITDWIPGQDPKDRMLLGTTDLNELPLEEKTLARIFNENGYESFFAGKWHLGSEGYYPEDHGFNYNFGGHEKGQPPSGYYSPYKNPKLSDGPEGEYLTDRLTDHVVEYLDTIGDQPFFMFMSYYTVHTPIEACEKHIEKFQKKRQEIELDSARIRFEGEGKTTLDQINPAYASMVYSMDENVGRIIQALKIKGLYDKTTIVFTSDNGGLSTLDRRYKRAKAPTSVLPLRAGKGWLYEGGIRVPLLIKPALYKKAKKQIDTPVVGHDLFPTLLQMAEIPFPLEDQMDGIDLSPIFHDTSLDPKRALFWHFPHYHGSGWTPGAAIRQGQWKLLEFHETGEVELYNLDKDLSEQTNLSGVEKEKTEELKKKLKMLQESMDAKFPTLNPDFFVPSGDKNEK